VGWNPPGGVGQVGREVMGGESLERKGGMDGGLAPKTETPPMHRLQNY